MSKRSRDPRDDPKSGPSKNQLRGLAYVGQKPAFLQNALSALAGGSTNKRQKPDFDANGRPTIPTRPGGADGTGSGGEEEEEEDEDEWNLGGGDEAPTVVVLKEGKHLDKEEVDRLRAQARTPSLLCSWTGSTVTESTAETETTKSKGSLSFSSGTGSKSKGKNGAGPSETWDSVVARSKNEAEAKQVVKEHKAADETKQKDKDDKRKKKEKKEAKKKIGMLSFAEE
ncbi:hypothetical protein JCM16303_001694 [Sporobolomyces ruberrimus]